MGNDVNWRQSTMLSKFLDPKNDLAFKRIFGSEKNKDILIHFLNDLFANTVNPIEEVTFLKTSSDPVVASQRTSIVDILCHDAYGDYFIVEMQVDFEPGFEKRAQYYAAKTYIQQREKGIEYKDLKQVTFLAITNYTLFPEQKEYLSHHHILNKDNYERQLKDFSFSFLELSKFKKKKEQLKTMTEKWAYFFKYAPQTQESDLTTIVGSDQIIGRAYEELNRYSWTTEELRTYDGIDMKKSAIKAGMEGSYDIGHQKGHQKGLREGRREGRQEGRQEGRREEKRELAKRLLQKGVPINEVVEITDLGPEEVIDIVENRE